MRLWTISFALGCCFAAWSSATAQRIWVIVTIILILSVIVWLRQPDRRTKTVIGSLIAAGIGASYLLVTASLQPALVDKPVKHLLLEGVVASIPIKDAMRTRFELEVERISGVPVAFWRKSRVSLSWYQRTSTVQSPVLQAGQRWQLVVHLRPPHGTLNPEGGDWERVMFARGIVASGSVVRSQANQLLAAPAWYSWRYWRHRWYQKVQSLTASLENSGLLVALLSGERQHISEAKRQLLSQTSTSHLIAISGLHIALVAAWSMVAMRMLLALFNYALPLRWRFSRPRDLALITAWLMAFIYALLAGFELPTQRAVIMLSCLTLALLMRTRFAPTQVLCAALLLVLIWDPLAVLSTNFWLSFGAVAVIMLSTSGRVHFNELAADPTGSHWVTSRTSAAAKVQNSGDGESEAHRFEELTARASSTIARWRTALLRAAGLQVKLSFTMLPFSIEIFGILSPLSAAINMIVVPAIGGILMPTLLLATLLGLIWPSAAQHLLLLVDYGLSGFWSLLSLGAPSAHFFEHWPTPTLTILGTLIGVIVILLLPVTLASARLAAILLLAGLTGACYWYSEPYSESYSELDSKPALRMTVLDIGQGMSILVESADKVLVYDTGAAFATGTALEGRLLPMLRQRRVDSIDVLVVSHGDNDHSGGAKLLAERMPIGITYFSDAPEKLACRSETDIAAPICKRCRAGHGWEWAGIKFSFLHPDSDKWQGNDGSCVVRIESRQGTVLLTGDIEALAERHLLETKASKLDAEILIAPHHGSLSSSTADFLSQVSPAKAVFSVGYANRFGFPQPLVLERYQQHGIDYFITACDGAVEIITAEDSDSLQLSGYRHQRPSLWRHYCD